MDPEAAAAAGQVARTFLLLVLAGLLTAALPLPWRVGSLVLTLAAIVVGLVGLRRAWRPGLRERFAPMLVFGLVFAVLVSMSTAGTIVLWPIEVAHQRCMSRAVTLDARQTCDDTYQKELEDALQNRLDDLMNRP